METISFHKVGERILADSNDEAEHRDTDEEADEEKLQRRHVEHALQSVEGSSFDSEKVARD